MSSNENNYEDIIGPTYSRLIRAMVYDEIKKHKEDADNALKRDAAIIIEHMASKIRESILVDDLKKKAFINSSAVSEAGSVKLNFEDGTIEFPKPVSLTEAWHVETKRRADGTISMVGITLGFPQEEEE